MKHHVVGRVIAIHRYLVKSMRGESLPQARVGWHGLDGDRRYAFVRGGDEGRFPWLTARELPRLLHYTPAFADPTDPANSPTLVTTPDGATMPVTSDALCAELASLAGEALHLLQRMYSGVAILTTRYRYKERRVTNQPNSDHPPVRATLRHVHPGCWGTFVLLLASEGKSF